MIQKKDEKLVQIIKYVMDHAPQLPYHNAIHALDVWQNARELGLREGITTEELYVLEPAALLHDIIVEPSRKDNEERSVDYTLQFMPKLGYTQTEAEYAGNIIMATKMPTNPKTPLEKIICDADVCNLGRRDFFEKGELLREEWNKPYGREWFELQANFLKGHHYYTESAQLLRDATKQENLDQVMKMIENYGK